MEKYKFYAAMVQFIGNHVNSFDVEISPKKKIVYSSRNHHFKITINLSPYSSFIEYKDKNIREDEKGCSMMEFNDLIAIALERDKGSEKSDLRDEQKEQLEEIICKHRPELI